MLGNANFSIRKSIYFIYAIQIFRIRIYQEITGVEIEDPMIHFGAVWVGISNAVWKIVIMSIM